MTTNAFDEAKAESFAGKMLDVMNYGMLGVLSSIGHQVGLFDVMSGLSPSTSEQIARASSLNERYVREWLAAMVTGGIVEYDPSAGTYALPPEHAQSLTRSAGAGNVAAFCQYIPMAAEVEQKVIDSFRNGGGVPYSAYTRFQQVMAEDSATVHDAALIEGILPIVPGLIERLQAGIEAADVGCGSGHAINLMAKAFPNSKFTGYDFSDEGIAAARAEAARLGLSNAHFEVRDAAGLDERDKYDFITAFDAIHDQAKPAQVLKNIAGALKPDGVFLMVDIAASSNLHENLEHPLAPMLYTVSVMHCMTVSLAYGGEGLGTMWGEQKARQYLADAGFTKVDVQQVEGDDFNSYYIATKR